MNTLSFFWKKMRNSLRFTFQNLRNLGKKNLIPYSVTSRLQITKPPLSTKYSFKDTSDWISTKLLTTTHHFFYSSIHKIIPILSYYVTELLPKNATLTNQHEEYFTFQVIITSSKEAAACAADLGELTYYPAHYILVYI